MGFDRTREELVSEVGGVLVDGWGGFDSNPKESKSKMG